MAEAKKANKRAVKAASKTVRKTGKSQMKDFPFDRAFTFFEPGPVLLVVTSIHGKPNVRMAMLAKSL